MALGPLVGAFEKADADVARRERDLAADLGRARFAVYGTAVAPDATSSPRITDGVVLPYEYNGTLAPTHTTFYGVYDRYYGHLGNMEWALPPRWVPAPDELDLSTPLNFIYLPARGRNIMVDVQAIQEALDKVYDADRIVLEILTGRLGAHGSGGRRRTALGHQ